MLFESTINTVAVALVIVALLGIVAIVLAGLHPGEILIAGIAAVVIIAVCFLIFAVFATAGADELWLFLYLVGMVLCCCFCFCVAGNSDRSAVRAITN